MHKDHGAARHTCRLEHIELLSITVTVPHTHLRTRTQTSAERFRLGHPTRRKISSPFDVFGIFIIFVILHRAVLWSVMDSNVELDNHTHC